MHTVKTFGSENIYVLHCKHSVRYLVQQIIQLWHCEHGVHGCQYCHLPMHMKYWLDGTISFGWEVTFGEYLTGKGASLTNQCWCQKTRVIALL